MQLTFSSGIALVAILALATSVPQPADAALKHRYSFTSDASDSVGTADGEVLDAGGLPNAVFANGMLDLTANIGEGSNVILEDAYVNLPNGIVSALGNSVTFEVWATVDTNRTWSQIFDFGRSFAGEDISTGGDGSKYITLIPQAGANRLEVHITQVGPGGGGGNPIRLEPAPLSTGVEHHLVTVVDAADTMGGTNPDGTAYLYLDGVEVARAANYPGFTVSSLDDINNWLGRSQWNDPIFDGSYNEFRLYDNALDPSDVALNHAAGPDLVEEVPADGILSLEVNTISGAVSLVNNTNVPLSFNYYEIASSGGALTTTGWNSLDDKELNDLPAEGWDESGGSNDNQLIELFVAEAGDTIGAGERLSLGNAFDISVFGNGEDGDLTLDFGLTTGALLPGGVTYITDTAAVPGDYNQNGAVDAADYTVWRDSVGTGSLPNEGDGISPGVVDEADYNFWKTNFGNTADSSVASAAAQIPEPTTVAMTLMALVAISGASLIGRR